MSSPIPIAVALILASAPGPTGTTQSIIGTWHFAGKLNLQGEDTYLFSQEETFVFENDGTFQDYGASRELVDGIAERLPFATNGSYRLNGHILTLVYENHFHTTHGCRFLGGKLKVGRFLYTRVPTKQSKALAGGRG